MADYWVSQERKFCEFCKCWIANNRPSVDFHEKGRRHQENVKKKLKNITRNTYKAHKESVKIDASLKLMEKAALESYRKDIENNGDLTSMAINKKIKDENLEIKGSKKVWHELKSRDGNLYYWNTITNETVWEPPKEGYLSLNDQREESLAKTKQELEQAERERRKQGMIRAQELKQEEMEEKARLAREKMKERRVEELPPVTLAPLIEPGNPSPYGEWETVTQSIPVEWNLPEQEYYEAPMTLEPEPIPREFKEKTVTQSIPVEWNLPEQEYYEAPMTLEPEPIPREFKEKTVEKLDGPSGETAFKKRKINFGNKKHSRQRLDND